MITFDIVFYCERRGQAKHHAVLYLYPTDTILSKQFYYENSYKIRTQKSNFTHLWSPETTLLARRLTFTHNFSLHRSSTLVSIFVTWLQTMNERSCYISSFVSVHIITNIIHVFSALLSKDGKCLISSCCEALCYHTQQFSHQLRDNLLVP